MKFSSRGSLRHFALLLALVSAVVFAGCSKLLPARKGTAHSAEMLIDTRRAPAESLSGRFIPAVFPAVTKIPVMTVQPIPPGAKFTAVSHEVVLKNGDELALLESVIENNQPYLKFAAAKPESFTQVHVLVRVKYEYR